jgi:hypothetical protein
MLLVHNAELNIETKHIVAVYIYIYIYTYVDIGNIQSVKILIFIICSAAVLPSAARTNVH